MVNLKWILPYLLISLPIYGGYKEQNKKENMKFFVEFVAFHACVHTLAELRDEHKLKITGKIADICNASGKKMLKELEKYGKFNP